MMKEDTVLMDAAGDVLPLSAGRALVAEAAVAMRQLVVFVLAGEVYGLDIAVVERILEEQPMTRVPHTPRYVAGLMNLHGTVLPVIDLRRRFGLAVPEFTHEMRIIIVEVKGEKVGLIVDAVLEVLRVPESTVELPSPLLVAVDSAYISGIVKTEGRLIALLDLEYVFSNTGGL